MAAVAHRSDTTAFAPRLARSAISAATVQHADVFARDERQSTAYSFSQTKPRPIEPLLQIGDQSVVIIDLDFGSGLPTWADPVLRSLSERWGVKPGWDSYDAQPTSIEHVVLLLNYLSVLMEDVSTPPIVTPLADGGVQAEWHRNGNELELVVPADEPARYYFHNATTKVEEEETLESNYARVKKLIGQF
jgi:hypothetical protein